MYILVAKRLLLMIYHDPCTVGHLLVNKWYISFRTLFFFYLSNVETASVQKSHKTDLHPL